jgi:hypothetical protein
LDVSELAQSQLRIGHNENIASGAVFVDQHSICFKTRFRSSITAST